MRLIYISQGNIPSKWAHTFQAMKMAEAFGQLASDFRLVTQMHWRHLFRGRFPFEQWYGIRRPFRVVRLIRRGFSPAEFYEQIRFPAFDSAAVSYCLRRRPDLVYTRSEPAGKLLVEAGLPTVIETHTHEGHWVFPLVLSVKDAPNLKGIVTISEVLRGQLIEAGVPMEKVLVLADAVDTEAFAALPSKAELRRKLCLPQSADIALYCGHLYPDRGIEDILQAASELPDVQFVFVGGWDKDVAERRTQSQRLANVSFLGFARQALVPLFLSAADVLLAPYPATCPTAQWMSPLKLFESMASGTPIIASDLAALRLHVTHGRNAWLVPPGDSASLARSIRRVLALPDRGRSMADAARADVAALTWCNRAQTILDGVAPGWRDDRPLGM